MLAALLVCTFLFAPVALAEHPADENPATCSEAHHQVVEDAAGHGSEQHQHQPGHSHGCGSCHVHVYPGTFAYVQKASGRLSDRIILPDDQGLLAGIASGLHRPPRV